MAGSKKIDVQWDTDEDLLEAPQTTEDNEFAALLADEALSRSNPSSTGGGRVQIGDQITATITYISNKSTDVLLDLGGKRSGVISQQEILDGDGQFTKKIGDKVTAYVVSIKDGEFLLSSSLAQGMRNEHALEAAFENQLPVKGKIAAVQKGGFTVTIFNRKAFCPVSQLSSRFIANPEEFVGKEFEFLIKSFNAHNIVVSRSQLLQQQAAATLQSLEEKMQSGDAIKGKVEEIKDFGLVVDLGGVSGLVHVSELGYGFTEQAGERYKVGDEISVKVLKIEALPGKNIARISLSCKALEENPWLTMSDRFHSGESYPGKVIRITEFGAFVELAPGIDGLIHLSEMSWGKRVHHPREVVKVGDQVSVRILDIDSSRQRISLSIKAVEDDPWFEVEKKFVTGGSYPATVTSLRTFGAIAELAPGVTGLLPISTLRQVYGDNYRKKAAPPAQLTVTVVSLALQEHKILLSLPNTNAQDDELAYFQQYLQEKEQAPPPAATSGDRQGSFGDLLKKSLERPVPK
jgi:small subunit ribosomal protein S1